MKKEPIDWFSVFLLCTAMLVWASSFIALKSAINFMGPMSITFGRMLIASLCFVYFIKRFSKLKFTKTDIKYILMMVGFEPILYFIFEGNALKYTTAGQAGMITSMMPLIVAVGAWMYLKENITKKLIVGSLLAVSGAIWLSFSSSSSANASNPLLGNTLEFFAMICGTGYALTIRYLSAKFSALFLTAVQSFAGAIFFFPLAIYEYNTIPMQINIEVLLWMLYLGVVVTLGGYGLFNLALSRMEASKASVYANLIPVFTVILAFLVLGEKLDFIEIAASVVILSGVFISQMPTERLKKVRFRRKPKL